MTSSPTIHDLAANQATCGTHRRGVGCDPLGSVHEYCAPHPVAGAATRPVHQALDTKNRNDEAGISDSSHSRGETQTMSAAVSVPGPAHGPDETQGRTGGSGNGRPPSSLRLVSPDDPGDDDGRGWLELRLAADLFDRAQRERMAVAAMLRAAVVHDDFFGQHLERLQLTEDLAKKMLVRTFRRVVPSELIGWQRAQPGVGEHLLARLLGHLGDPYVATPHYWEGGREQLMVEEPRVRSIGQLWQYCGHGAPARRRRGMTDAEAAALGSPMLKMLVHLNAEACMKYNKGKPAKYRSVYLATRSATADKVHAFECVRCGPAGKPAPEGSPWSDGHSHAHALRIVGKELLRDMWIARHAAESKAVA